ncbi:MAG: phosphoglycerate mutase [Frankiales bacterium]|nr:phosphoglycerate mutase [Frankiales bacterium]
MELVLVRHALPLRVDVAPDGGPADPGLAERGREQAQRLVEALRLDDVAALYTSPRRRARETAAPLEQALGLTAEVEADLDEFDRDDPSYVPVEELAAANDPRYLRLLNGDLYSENVDPVAFRKRVVAAVESVVARHPSGTAVLVCHAGVCNAYLGHVLSQDKPIWYAPAYCSVNRVMASRTGRRAVRSMNETMHVRDLLAP